MNEFGSNVEHHRRKLLLHCYCMLGSCRTPRTRCRRRCFVPGGIYRVATNERLPRKYVCGVVPSIVRNISMNALTLS